MIRALKRMPGTWVLALRVLASAAVTARKQKPETKVKFGVFTCRSNDGHLARPNGGFITTSWGSLDVQAKARVPMFPTFSLTPG